MMATGFGAIDDDNEFSATGVMLRAGGGLNIRLSDRFSLQPELTIMKPFDQGDSIAAMFYTAGIGINFGTLPGFGDDEPAKDKAD
jgi:hypothetical protein